MQRFKDIVKSISSTHTDVRAEVVIADLLEKNIGVDKINIIHEGSFVRNYKKDLIDVYVDFVKEVVTLHITRNSIYDNLPEGLFHPVSRRMTSESRIAEFEKQRIEEQKARKFFQPFDREFMLQKVEIERQVRKLFQDPMSELEKWYSNEKKIPREFFRQLVKFLPFTNRIKGNALLTAECLSKVIGEKVSVQCKYKTLSFEQEQPVNVGRLGSSNLGENVLCGNKLTEDIMCWDFTVELMEDCRLEIFVDTEKGFMKDLISKFYDYFVPFEIVITTKIICLKKNKFQLTRGEFPAGEEKHDKSYLGYNTTI